MNTQHRTLICIGGLPASGKTTLACNLQSQSFNDAVLIDPDRTMLRLLGRSEGTIASADLTPALISNAIAIMQRETKEALTAGYTVIVASAFAREKMRQDFEALAHETLSQFHPFWLEAPIPVLHERARKRIAASQDSENSFTGTSKVDIDKITFSLIEGNIHWPRIDASKSPDSVLESVMKWLGD